MIIKFFSLESSGQENKLIFAFCSDLQISLFMFVHSVVAKDWDNFYVDALHLSIPAQGLPNGEAALQHAAAYPGMQPYPGVGEWNCFFHSFFHCLQMPLSLFRNATTQNCPGRLTRQLAGSWSWEFKGWSYMGKGNHILILYNFLNYITVN